MAKKISIAQKYAQGTGEGRPTFVPPVRYGTGPNGYVIPPKEEQPTSVPTTVVQQVPLARPHASTGYCNCTNCAAKKGG